MSTMSGMTFVFDDPAVPTTFGENVVCVQAWRCAGAPAFGSAGERRRRCRLGSSSAASGRRRVRATSTCAAPQLVEARRRAVLGEALHDRGRLHQRVVDAGTASSRGPACRAGGAGATPRPSRRPSRRCWRLPACRRGARRSRSAGSRSGSRRRGGRRPSGRRGRCPPPRRRRRSRGGRPRAGTRASPSERKTTAIDAVRLSMSTAPRPHTSPSISSPPNGSCRQPSGVTGTTSVWPIRHSDGRGRIGAWDAGDERGPARRRLPAARCRRRPPSTWSAARRRCAIS